MAGAPGVVSRYTRFHTDIAKFKASKDILGDNVEFCLIKT